MANQCATMLRALKNEMIDIMGTRGREVLKMSWRNLV